MQKRWFIHKDDKAAGPYAAAEMRQLLREGQVDPFDLVSVEGSSVQQELVEVDEIFVSDNVGYGKAASGDGGFSPQIQERSAAQDRLSQSPRTQPPGQLIALASDMRKIGHSGNLPVPIKDENAQLVPVPRRKKDPKRYHLIDGKGRVLGPLSPGEIQSLYYRGVVDKNVKVLRDSSSSKVPVAKFVLAYAEAQGVAKTPKQGAHPHIQGFSKSALNRMALARRAQQMREVTGMAPATVAILCIAFVLIALTVGLLVRDGTLFKGSESERPRQERPLSVKKSAVKQPERSKTPKAPASRYNRPSAPKSGLGGALGRPASKTKTRRAVNVERPVRRTPPARVTQRPAPTRTQVRPMPPAMAPARPLVRPVMRPVAQPRPLPVPAAPTPAPSPAPVAKPAAPKGGQSVPTLADGQTVTGLGPMSYNKVAVDICEGACSIVFTGAGGSVTVAFFKNAWGQKLMEKSGKVYISGLVRKNGDSVKILLTGVR